MSFKRGKQSSIYKYMMSFLEEKTLSFTKKSSYSVFCITESSLHYNVVLAMHLFKAVEFLIIGFLFNLKKCILCVVMYVYFILF